MKKEFCIAAARLIYDIIGADGYVSDRELDIMDRLLNDKYGMTIPERAYEVNRITFCDALKVLQEWDDENDVETLMSELKLIAGVGKLTDKGQPFSRIEGHCSLSEAWLLLAVEYALNEKALVFSVSKSDYRFARSEIIYLENSSTNYSIYKEMEEHYREYRSTLELFGMRLVYIPRICSYLKMKREQRKLMPLMRYVSPFHKYEDKDAQKIADNIDNIATKDFAQDLFSHEAQIYNHLRPSFLLKVSTSLVKEEKMRKKSNFMLIPILGSVGETLTKALNKYRDYTLDLHMPERKLHGRPFRLHGFDRTFLNFVMSRVLNTDNLTKIVFDFSSFKKECVQFVFEDKRTVEVSLRNKQMCLYLLIILYTIYKKGVPMERAIKRKNVIKMDVEQVFCSIYNKVKENCDGELYDGKGRLATDITRIAQRMKDIPLAYHVVTKDSKAAVNFPCRDVVYVKFGNKQILLCEIVEEMRMKEDNKRIDDVFCCIF